MSKSKPHGKKKKINPVIKFKLDSEIFTKYPVSILIALIIFPAILSGYYVYNAFEVNGFFSFPLDDPWIHLTFARNIAEYQSFSYYKNELATAGSTSPLYTFILSAGFLITSYEMVMSYVLGILFFIGAAIAIYFLAGKEFGSSSLLALFCAGFFITDKWMNFVAGSGMETTMYIMLLILGAYFYKQRKPVPTGIILGLILWARPDGVAFIGAMVVHYFYTLYANKNKTDVNLFSNRDYMKIGLSFSVIILIYFGLNLSLSGSLLPNTYNAKLTYYSPEFRNRGDFLKFEVWNYFTSGTYAIFMAGALLSIIFIGRDVIAKKRNDFLLYLIFILSLIFVYWYKLPYAHRFGRYLMPVIPFLILLAIYGFSNSAKYISQNFMSSTFVKGITVIVLIVTLLYSFLNYTANAENYAYECKYIYDRHVRAALWLNENTDEDEIIGTHDVGAIGFYSQRKIVDAAGLITPELITKLNSPEYATYMKQYMTENNVSYLAFLREWYRVVNQEPLFTTKEISPVEVMEIFRFDPDAIHILSNINKSMIMYAEDALSRKNPQQALGILQRAVREDPNSSLAYFLLSYTYSLLGDERKMEENLLRAIEIHPNYVDALTQLGNLYLTYHNYLGARTYLRRALETDPGNENVIHLLNLLAESEKNGGLNAGE